MTEGPLHGRTALVTGASRGIGAACALALARDGARVALAARSAEALESVASGLPGEAVVIEADLGEPGAAQDLARAAEAALGGIDILVNNAGTPGNRRAEKIDDALLDRVLALNVRAPLLLATALAPEMEARGRGSIINISSVTGVMGSPFQACYAASKGAVDGMTRCLAAEWGPRGIRVNAVAPGLIVTEMWTKGREVEGIVEAGETRTALRRWGDPDDVADVVAFLASDAARYVTGQVVVVDGGLCMQLELLPSRRRPRPPAGGTV